MQTAFVLMLICVLLCLGCWFGFQRGILFRRGLRVGRQIEDIDGSIHTPSGKDEKLLIHFFNPNSALCRIQGLAIDNLQKEFRNILRFDTSHHEEVARAFRVSQTPTMVVLARKKVEYVFVGVTDEEKLRRCLVP